MSRASQVIEAKAAELNAAADAIWETPELAFTEYQSAKILIDFLRKEGFTVEEELAGIRTAFSGRFGHGRPVLGVLGEFDALSGLGQEAGALEKKPNGKTAGQGCGHNLLGVGSLAAALAVKRYLEETGAEGTIVYYGCPGEEGRSGTGRSGSAGRGWRAGRDRRKGPPGWWPSGRPHSCKYTA